MTLLTLGVFLHLLLKLLVLFLENTDIVGTYSWILYVERYVGNGFGHLEIIISIADTKKTVTNIAHYLVI